MRGEDEAAASDSLNEFVRQSLDRIELSESAAALETARVELLGKKGALTEQLKRIGSLPAKERPAAGERINAAKIRIQAALDARRAALEEVAMQAALDSGAIDVSLPGRREELGSVHPITRTRLRIESIFRQAGFTVETGPEIEDDFHNFTALNIPPNHPARAMHDTFYFPDGELLRTHTSPVQIRTMLTREPPFSLIAPGRVYRADSDITHTPMFHQVEGLVLGSDVSFANLKAMLASFLEHFFDRPVQMRLRASYFPFTEPSAEVDVECVFCGGSGCQVCKATGWLEVLGCGMVHPEVLAACRVDSERWQGYAFGMGVERLAMLLYDVGDLRLFFDNDLRFLRQFG